MDRRLAGLATPASHHEEDGVTPVLRLEVRPLTRMQRLWYWRLRIPAPMAIGSDGPWHEVYARLLPQRWSRTHRAYAHRYGLFWIPCVLCDRYYGGHQSGGRIPDPFKGAGRSIGICPRCTRDGCSFEANDPS